MKKIKGLEKILMALDPDLMDQALPLLLSGGVSAIVFKGDPQDLVNDGILKAGDHTCQCGACDPTVLYTIF